MDYKKGDRIIWDSGFGYEIGYFLNDNSDNMYYSYNVHLVTGRYITGEVTRMQNEIKPYTPEYIKVMVDNYGYEHSFEGKDIPIDLFEHYEVLPEDVQNIIHSFDENNDAYKECEKMLKALEPYGYTFDYYLDGVPYNLRKV